MPEVVASASPMVAAPGALSLLRPKWQMARNRTRHHQRGDLRRVVVMSVVALGFWSVAFLLALKLLRYFRSAEDIGALLASKLLAMILLSFGSILLLSNTIAALSNFFLSRDLDQLAAAPVGSGALYRARLAETAMHSSWMVALLLVPLVGAYGVAYRGGLDFVLFALAVFVPFLLIPAAMGSGVTLLLVNVFPARRTRDLLSVIAAMAVAGLVLLFRAARPEQLARPEGFANFMQFVAALDTPSSPWLPSEWVSEAVVKYLSGKAAWQPLVRLWAVAAVLVGIGHLLYARGWRRAYSMAQEGATKRGTALTQRPRLDRALACLGPLRRELVLKELRVFSRDSTQWSQLVLLAVLLVVYVANVRYLPLDGEGVTVLLRNLIPFLNLALAGFVLASIAARFVFPSVSLEGRAWWLLRSSPLPVRELLWAKFWVGAIPLLVLALVLVGATNVMLRVQPFVHVVSLVSIAALVFPLAALALSYGAFHPQFDSENAAQIPTSFGGLLFMVSAVGLIGAVAYLAGRPAARWIVAEHFGRARDPMDMVVPFAIALAVCAAGTVIPLTLARRQLEQLERA
ncbi:MAG: putative ABC transporter permease subunit [Gemmatimonas sp.]|jgi:ABC-2 type transport system permease protein